MNLENMEDFLNPVVIWGKKLIEFYLGKSGILVHCRHPTSQGPWFHPLFLSSVAILGCGSVDF